MTYTLLCPRCNLLFYSASDEPAGGCSVCRGPLLTQHHPVRPGEGDDDVSERTDHEG